MLRMLEKPVAYIGVLVSFIARKQLDKTSYKQRKIDGTATIK